MTQVKIYTATPADLSPPVESKSFCVDVVLANDYQALQEQVAALAAENAALKSAAKKVIKMNRQHAKDQHGDPMIAESWSCVKVLRKAKSETPATDAFIADQQAIGVEKLANLAAKEFDRDKSVKDRAGARKWKSIVILCSDFARLLRDEVKP